MPIRFRRLLLLLTVFAVALVPASAMRAQAALETTSLLGRKLYAQPDDAAITAAKQKLSGVSATAGDYVALSRAEAGRRQYGEGVKADTQGLARFPNDADLLLERGHRELGLREFAAAQKDLQHAVEVDPAKLDSHYHLGLAFYFQGEFAEAAVHFSHARDLAKSDDSLIDCSNWLYVSLRRAGKPKEAADVLTRITPAMHNTEPHLLFYLKLLRFYQGGMTEQQIQPAPPAPGDAEAELSFNTLSYGIGNYHLYNGDKPAAFPFFKRVVTGDSWNAWGFIASEIELARRPER